MGSLGALTDYIDHAFDCLDCQLYAKRSTHQAPVDVCAVGAELFRVYRALADQEDDPRVRARER